VTVEPWNSSLIWRSKSTRRGSWWLSPIGFFCRFGRKGSETLGFPGKRRKRHAETTEPSGKSGLETVIPYLGEQADQQINDRVRAVAAEEELLLLDTHARYAAERKHGRNRLSYRRVQWNKVPAKYRPLVPAGSVKGSDVAVLDNLLDAHLRGVPDWFRDRHPNLAGYHVIGDEAAKFLAPLIRERVKAAAKP